MIYLRWALVILLLGLFGLATSPFFVPLAWLTRNWNFNPFWIWVDDGRYNQYGQYSRDYIIILQNRFGTNFETFKSFCYWHIKRNRVWNLKELFTVPFTLQNDIEITDLKIDNLYFMHDPGKLLKQDGEHEIFAGLKYVPKYEGQNPWQINQGTIINKNTSIIGEGWIEYKVGKWKSFRYSQCKIIEYKIFGIRIWKGWRTIKIGTNGKRYVDTVKHQPIVPQISY